MYIYQLVQKTVKGLDIKNLTINELQEQFEINGINKNTSSRIELQGKPLVAGFLGPMYNGVSSDGNIVIRYETSEIYKEMSF